MDSQPDPGFGLFKVEFSRFRVLKRFGLGQLESEVSIPLHVLQSEHQPLTAGTDDVVNDKATVKHLAWLEGWKSFLPVGVQLNP